MPLQSAKYRRFIDAAADLAGLPAWGAYPAGVWLESVCVTESSGDPSKTHFDPGHSGPTSTWTSYGLFQIEGGTARVLTGVDPHTDNDLSWLHFPEINTALAVRLLSTNLRTSNQAVDAALAAYNGGFRGAQRLANGDLADQAYVDRVSTNCHLVTADRAASSPMPSRPI